jgi:hypothetical protein
VKVQRRLVRVFWVSIVTVWGILLSTSIIGLAEPLAEALHSGPRRGALAALSFELVATLMFLHSFLRRVYHGENAYLQRALGWAAALGFATINFTAHEGISSALFAGASIAAAMIAAIVEEAALRDQQRLINHTAPRLPAYPLSMHLTPSGRKLLARAQELAARDPLLGLYGSIDAAKQSLQADVDAAKEAAQIARLEKVLTKRFGKNLKDGNLAEIAASAYDMRALARELAGLLDPSQVAQVIAAEISPDRVTGRPVPDRSASPDEQSGTGPTADSPDRSASPTAGLADQSGSPVRQSGPGPVRQSGSGPVVQSGSPTAGPTAESPDRSDSPDGQSVPDRSGSPAARRPVRKAVRSGSGQVGRTRPGRRTDTGSRVPDVARPPASRPLSIDGLVDKLDGLFESGELSDRSSMEEIRTALKCGKERARDAVRIRTDRLTAAQSEAESPDRSASPDGQSVPDRSASPTDQAAPDEVKDDPGPTVQAANRPRLSVIRRDAAEAVEDAVEDLAEAAEDLVEDQAAVNE